jgi:nucleoside phosphorylase
MKNTQCYLLQILEIQMFYVLGRIGSHNAVIACLPDENTGKVSAAIVAKDMLRSFKAIRFGLMVGIGGAAPFPEDQDLPGTDSEDSEEEDNEAAVERDIRLGDVVVSLQTKTTDAVLQYDFGKSLQGGEFIQNGRLNIPANILRSTEFCVLYVCFVVMCMILPHLRSGWSN